MAAQCSMCVDSGGKHQTAMPDVQGSLKSREKVSRVQASVSQRSTAVKWTLFHGLMALRASARTSGDYPSALDAVMPHGGYREELEGA